MGSLPVQLLYVMMFAQMLPKPTLGLPRFDPTAMLQNVLVPADAAVGTVVYRLRASEPLFDYPLGWRLSDGPEAPGSGTVVDLDALNCTRFNSVCQANVVLRKRLEPGRFYDFRVVVTNRRGTRSNTMDCSFRATNATTPIGEIFPGAPTLLMVSENARRNTELGTVITKGNPARDRPVLLELWGSPEFSLRQRLTNSRDAEGTVLLLGKLDYETTTVHHLTILANDPWTDMSTDTRNIMAWPLLVAVLDEQDTPPVFTLAPPTTQLEPDLHIGDIILTVHAEDGDKGHPRDIKYSLQGYGMPYTEFFNINEDTGQLRLAKPITELQAVTHSTTPIIISVIAEEVRSIADELPTQSSTINLALIPPLPVTSSPRFSAREFHTMLEENSAPGTLLNLTGAELVAQPGIVFALELGNNNGTFDVSPGVVEGRSKFMIKVRDNTYLDYEARHTVRCDITAREISGKNLTATATLIVTLEDVNDNPPRFAHDTFKAELSENANIGTSVIKVTASDVDGNNDKIKYAKLLGKFGDYFSLNESSGVITVRDAQALDAEENPVITLQVEAVDDSGKGNSALVEVVITLVDMNDMAPVFEKNTYEFIVRENQRSFTVPAFVKANDGDTTSPNNNVKYELIEAVDNLHLNSDTGELMITDTWDKYDVVTLRVRAYDGGVPRLWSECQMRIYPPDGLAKKLVFIVNGRNPNRYDTEAFLSEITGGKVQVNEIRPYTGREPGAYDFSNGGDRSVVYTTVTHSQGSVIDVQKIQETLDHYSRERQDAQNGKQQTEVIKTSSSGNWWWLLLVILLILLLLALLLVLCCVLQGCPLYLAPRKRRQVASAEQLVVKVQDPGPGTESKSVQVAEWFGRREAWTPEGHVLEADLDRHEIERGSDRGAANRKQPPPKINAGYQTQAEPRDQFYIREGNADILRLITRGGNEPQVVEGSSNRRPVTLVQDQYVTLDSGKDILLRRFIDQQAEVTARQNVLLPNAVTRLQTENELLEESLRQQNAMLRQILQDREREIRLETQSLPAGTQTEQNVSTQTEPLFLRPPRRQTRSDNDASDNSEDDERKVVARKRRIAKKVIVKRKITTPIEEENESNVESAETQTNAATEARLRYGTTKSSRLRMMKNAADRDRDKDHDGDPDSASTIRQEVLREISDSLIQSSTTTSDETNQQRKSHKLTKQEKANIIKLLRSNIDADEESFSDDSLEDDSPSMRLPSPKDNSSKRYHSALDLRPPIEEALLKSHSQSDLRRMSAKAPTSAKVKKKSAARYMEWYDKKAAEMREQRKRRERDKVAEKPPRRQDPMMVRDAKSSVSSNVAESVKSSQAKTPTTKLSKRLLRPSQQPKAPSEAAPSVATATTTAATGSNRKRIELPLVPGPEHPLIQHSRNRFEVNVLPAPVTARRGGDEDVDSGIVLSRPPMAEKRSVFTIAYNEMQPKRLPEPISTPP